MKNFLHTKVKSPTIEENKNVSSLVAKMGATAFQGKNLSLFTDLWLEMLQDEVTIFLGLAGAMVPAGMREIIVHLIKNRYIDCLVSTGANLFHDCHETLGRFHYQGIADVDDLELLNNQVDRIYDVFASEKEFGITDDYIKEWANGLDFKESITTREFFYLLGEKLSEVSRVEGIITSAYKAKIPIYCPAIGDSSIGITLALGLEQGNKPVTFDVIRDVLETAQIAHRSKGTGVIYIGGGTPKNFIQQTEVTAMEFPHHKNQGHKYALQIIVDAPHWGGLSGCTFKEAQSWGKIAKNARNVTLHCDATIALPIVVTALTEKSKEIMKLRRRPSFDMGKKLEIY